MRAARRSWGLRRVGKVSVFTCTACKAVFRVPWYELESQMPPEMMRVIEHEEAHRENGEFAGWEEKVKEVTFNVVDIREEEKGGAHPG